MKKIILLLIVFCFSTFVIPRLKAQTSKLEIGLEAGPGLGTLYGDEYFTENQTVLLCYSAGLSIQANITNHFSISFIPSYATKGSSSETTIIGLEPETETQKFKFDYIILPILAKLSLGNKIRFFLNAGPFVGLLLKQTIELESGGEKTTEDYSDYYKKADAGVAVGAGLGLILGDKIGVSFEARNSRGLIELQKIEGTPVTKTNTINFLFGLSYRISGSTK